MRRSGMALALVGAMLVACRDLVGPEFPSDAVRFTPPSVYQLWWTMTETCSGLRGSLSDIGWYRAPAASIAAAQGDQIVGLWTNVGNRILLADEVAQFGRAVRHEMLHALVRRGGHPRVQFLERCAGVVDCESRCVAAAGPARPHDPLVLLVPPESLRLSVAPFPANPSPSLYDGFFQTTVSAYNTASHAVLVPLPNLSAGFGLRLDGGGTHTRGSMPVWDPALPYFLPGETKRFVFDLLVDGPPGRVKVQPGPYDLRGGFGGHWSTAVRMLVVP